MPEVFKKEVAWFHIAPQVRKVFSKDSIESLAASLVSEGQLAAVGAMEDGLLLWGERRLMAAKHAGLPTLDTYIFTEPLTETQVKIIQWSENQQREQLKPIEECLACCELAALQPDWTNKQLAEALHLCPTMVTRLRTYERCCPEVRKALADDLIGLSDMYAIGKTDFDKQKELLALKLSGATRDQIESHRKHRNGNGHAPAVKVSKIQCPVPTTRATITIASEGEGFSLSELHKWLVALAKECKESEQNGLDARTFSAVMKQKSKAKT